MRHKVAGRGFGRNTKQRKALLRGLVISLLTHLKIETTVAKAKETRKIAEKIITLGKKGDLHARRLAMSSIPDENSITKLFNEIAPKISRTSGYLRVLQTRNRIGDNASMAVLEFVDYEKLQNKEEIEQKAKKKEAKAAKAETTEK
ncbi:MAG: 50S ribosomal protein L17 [Thermodesulfovibrionia bacterium]|nr:50S ribosomal protein L17 [Nitrospirota bacterium]MDO8282229.1 50S ribosomal protein L17 [Thermodesulfovibrionia bacterium]